MAYANLAPKFACHLCVTIDPLRVRAAHLRRRGGKAALDGVLQTPAPDGCPSMRGKRCSIRRLVHHGKRTRRPAAVASEMGQFRTRAVQHLQKTIQTFGHIRERTGQEILLRQHIAVEIGIRDREK